MPIEGISMTTVFSLVAVGLAISLSSYIGGYYLRPIFDVDTLMASVAYDLATIYDLAYTLPGEVMIRYYGPNVCKWNPYGPSDSPESFHCIDARSVIINDVFVEKQYLLVFNDPYADYDSTFNKENPILKYMDDLSIASAISIRRPAYLYVALNYFNRQVSGQIDTENEQIFYGSLATAPISASYTDINMMLDTETPKSFQVDDYSFVVKKSKVGNYYYTLASNPRNPQELTALVDKISSVFDSICTSKDSITQGTYYSFEDDNPLHYYENLSDYTVVNVEFSNKQDFFLKLYPGIRLSVRSSNIAKLSDSWSFDNGAFSDLGRTDFSVDNAVQDQGLFSKAYKFDGSACLASSSMPSLSKLAVSLWINPSSDTVNIYQYLVSNNRDCCDATTKGFGLRINSNKKVEFHLGKTQADTFVLASNTTLSKNMWYHLVADYDGSTAKIYINGRLDAQGSYSASDLKGSYGITVGELAYSDGYYGFKGLIDDVKLFHDSLSESEIIQLYSSVPGIFLCQERLSLSYDTSITVDSNSLDLAYSFDNYKIKDEDYFNEINREMVRFFGIESGVYSNALNFTGFQKLFSEYYPNLDKMTVSFWINPKGLGETQYLVSNNNINEDSMISGFGVRLNEEKHLEFHVATGVNDQGVLESSSQILPNEWTHVLITFEYGEAKIYLNNKLDASDTFDVFSISSSYPLTIGGVANYNESSQDIFERDYGLGISPQFSLLFLLDNPLNFPGINMGLPSFPSNYMEDLVNDPSLFEGSYKGLMDELRIFNKALSDEEIEYLYNNPGSRVSSLFLEKVKLNDYYTEYCFNLDLLKQRSECANVSQIIVSSDFINIINDRTLYYASWNSCLKPFLFYDPVSKKLIVNASLAEFNIIAGGCHDK